ncbi:hypothetical protein SKAU_G00129210 [Synaphobranchus kaupii]|uniref:Stannin n=1 Tax=Synaphobranchus kaupii TaxID=118154 RepID=A0A9Q1FQ20_SYNKA|nr:hypothetical protein SKAU_G00129210 [Synaphobranchus kaupii]
MLTHYCYTCRNITLRRQTRGRIVDRRRQGMKHSSGTKKKPETWLHCRTSMSIMDHSATTGVVTVIVILIAIAALGALILGCWCYLRLQRIGQSEDEESIVGEGETKEPFLLVQYSAKGPRVEHKTKLTPSGTESHS